MDAHDIFAGDKSKHGSDADVDRSAAGQKNAKAAKAKAKAKTKAKAKQGPSSEQFANPFDASKRRRRA